MPSNLPKTRLELLMKMTGVTGKVLSNSLHFDMSLISRWKNGKRKLLNETYLRTIVTFFYELEDGKYHRTFQGLLNLEPDAERIEVIEAIEEWLTAPLLEQDMAAIIAQNQPVDQQTYLKSYIGNKGRRDAVVEFLTKAAAIRSQGKLYLISREDMSWMIEDPSFMKHWARLLKQCIMVGYEIYIIHTIRRSMDELYSAFVNWIPFYMTGRVKAYYMPSTESTLPVQTLFILQDLLLCEGNCFRGDPTERYTALTNDITTVISRQKDYTTLLDNATQLNYLYNAGSMRYIINAVVSAGKNKQDSLFKADELFMSTMTNELFMEVLENNDVDETTKGYCLEFYERLSGNFQQNVRMFTNRHIYNLERLIEHAEAPSFKSVLLSIVTGKEVMITSEQYIRHLRSTIVRLINNPNYEIGLYKGAISDLPLENMDFWVKEGYYLAMWSKHSYEFIQMSQEPTMVETIKRFYTQLWDMIPIIDKEKTHVVELLEKLIIIAKNSQQEATDES